MRSKEVKTDYRLVFDVEHNRRGIEHELKGETSKCLSFIELLNTVLRENNHAGGYLTRLDSGSGEICRMLQIT